MRAVSSRQYDAVSITMECAWWTSLLFCFNFKMRIIAASILCLEGKHDERKIHTNWNSLVFGWEINERGGTGGTVLPVVHCAVAIHHRNRLQNLCNFSEMVGNLAGTLVTKSNGLWMNDRY